MEIIVLWGSGGAGGLKAKTIRPAWVLMSLGLGFVGHKCPSLRRLPNRGKSKEKAA